MTRIASDGAIIARYAAKGVVRLTLSGAEALLDLVSWKGVRGVSSRRRSRPGRSTRWLLDDEIEIVGVLAALVVPADETGPGAHEAGVVRMLDSMIAGSPPSQHLYEYGLLALNELARRAHGASFVALPRERQIELLEDLDRMSSAIARGESTISKMRSAALTLRLSANGSLAAARMFPRLVDDVKQAFYTSRVGWEWLGYDGPPMPEGYPDLRTRSSPPAPSR